MGRPGPDADPTSPKNQARAAMQREKRLKQAPKEVESLRGPALGILKEMRLQQEQEQLEALFRVTLVRRVLYIYIYIYNPGESP